MTKRNLIILFSLLTLIISVVGGTSNSTNYIEEGKIALNESKYEDSIQFFDYAITEQKDLFTAYNNKGVAQLRLGNCNQSISSFMEALKQNSRNPNTLLNLALAQKCAGDRAGAYNSLNTGINLSLDNAGLFLTRAIMEREDERYEEAIHDINRSILIESHCAECSFELSNTLFLMNDFVGSYDAILKASNLSPADPQINYNRGVIEERLALYRDAIKSYDHTLSIEPTNIKALFNKGSIYWNHYQINESLKLFDQIVEIDPSFSDAWFYRGLALKELGYINESIRSFNNASALKPDNKMYRAYSEHYRSLPTDKKNRPIPTSILSPVIGIIVGFGLFCKFIGGPKL